MVKREKESKTKVITCGFNDSQVFIRVLSVDYMLHSQTELLFEVRTKSIVTRYFYSCVTENFILEHKFENKMLFTTFDLLIRYEQLVSVWVGLKEHKMFYKQE